MEIAFLGWCLYSDQHTHRLRRRYAVAPEGRRIVARAVLFLQSDQEYEWTTEEVWETSLFRCLFRTGLLATGILSSGILKLFSLIIELLITIWAHCRWIRTETPRDAKDEASEPGDTDVWPFYREPDLEAAKQNPRFLIGKQPV